ncbi:uncharacterized protein LOC135705091 [Ochlerotatus camptorhynchus]|uniref:uncharacterized protein LOC135705091 n=1 Tax=Ochlerotatus camptorhynchus TaxID=644619 RepID=UPI0031DBA4D4
MVFQWNAVAVTTIVLVLMQAQLSHSRPKDSKQTVADRRRDDELTRETQIGESKVYGLIHDESEGKEAIQEKEDLHSKILSMFDNVQQKIVKLLNSGAVVDKATPKDYEPNPIEDYEALRKGIVNVVDFFAKQINAIIDAPKNILRKANKNFTKTLNDFGSKLSGLE